MGLDIRTPIGLLFTALGALLSLYGLLGDKSIYQRSLGLNVNFGWGIVLLLFGLAMLAFGLRRARAKNSQAVASAAGQGKA
jgi:hypothetical protein